MEESESFRSILARRAVELESTSAPAEKDESFDSQLAIRSAELAHSIAKRRQTDAEKAQLEALRKIELERGKEIQKLLQPEIAKHVRSNAKKVARIIPPETADYSGPVSPVWLISSRVHSVKTYSESRSNGHGDYATITYKSLALNTEGQLLTVIKTIPGSYPSPRPSNMAHADLLDGEYAIATDEDIAPLESLPAHVKKGDKIDTLVDWNAKLLSLMDPSREREKSFQYFWRQMQ